MESDSVGYSRGCDQSVRSVRPVVVSHHGDRKTGPLPKKN